MLLPGLKKITSEGQWAAFINPPHIPYAPALANAGIRLDRLLIIDSQNDTNALWATEQVLRSGLFSGVTTWLARSTPQKQRRLQKFGRRSWQGLGHRISPSAGRKRAFSRCRSFTSIRRQYGFDARGTQGPWGQASNTHHSSF